MQYTAGVQNTCSLEATLKEPDQLTAVVSLFEENSFLERIKAS
jgi:hypothetical protein